VYKAQQQGAVAMILNYFKQFAHHEYFAHSKVLYIDIYLDAGMFVVGGGIFFVAKFFFLWCGKRQAFLG